MRLEQMRWAEVETYLQKDDRIILPIGSTEQHGPRGILGTDGLVAEGIAVEVARRGGVLCAPVLMYGMAEHHLAFPGTLSLSPTTYQSVLKDLLKSFIHHGLNRVMIINGHGGNIGPVNCTLSEVVNTYLDLRVQFHSWFELPVVEALTEQLFQDREGGHGTPGEVSVTMHLFPDIEFPVLDHPPGLTGTNVFFNHKMIRELSPSGLFGNAQPNLATADHGASLMEAAVVDLVGRLDQWT